MNPELRAVFWDFGGVFTTSPFDAFNRYEAALVGNDLAGRLSASEQTEWAALQTEYLRFSQNPPANVL